MFVLNFPQASKWFSLVMSLCSRTSSGLKSSSERGASLSEVAFLPPPR